jgi:hypothetical protein
VIVLARGVTGLLADDAVAIYEVVLRDNLNGVTGKVEDVVIQAKS